MILTKSIALSILAALGVQGLVIPSAGEVIDVFNQEKSRLSHDVKASEASFKQSVSKLVPELKHSTASVLEKLNISLLGADQAAPMFAAHIGRDAIPHKYLVMFKENVSADEASFHKEWVALQHITAVGQLADKQPEHVFFTATKDFKPEGGIVDSFDLGSVSGYSGYFTEDTIDLVRRHPAVRFVEQDSMVYASEFDVQKGAPWGLARVSHRPPLSLNSFNQYLHDTEGGDGVTAYVIDTGVNVEHVEFHGRASWGSTIPYGDADEDGNGHGTHCAGTIASDAYGVAKKAKVVAVKVLRSNGSGSMSDVVKGVEYAAKAHQEAAKASKKGFKGSTANMSLGGGKSTALDLTVDAAVRVGLHFAVAAGNENQDACNTSPASSELAITVGASTISDARAYFSNYGKCVDIFAPGLNILSTYIGSDTATATLSGTSMASPHIAGLLSYYLSLQPSTDSAFFTSGASVTPAQLKKNLIAFGSKDVLSDIPEDTPNVLAYNGGGKNITDFWGAAAGVQQQSKPVSISEKLESLEALLEKEGASLIDQVSNFVDKIYHA